MLGFNESLQAAIYAQLSTLELDGEDLRVYDRVPQASDAAASSTFPYVTIGDISMLDGSTDDSDGAMCIARVHIWSRYEGSREAQRIEKLVYDALNDQQSSLLVTDYECVFFLYESTEMLDDPDGITRHSVVSFRAFLDQTE